MQRWRRFVGNYGRAGGWRLDTEFVGEDSFIPKLELIQVAAQDISAVIDFPAVQTNGSLAPFWELICDPQVEKIVHAGRQDLDLFALHAGQIPKPFFDTQIAAAMLGFGAQVAYANLVQRIHGTKLDESPYIYQLECPSSLDRSNCLRGGRCAVPSALFIRICRSGCMRSDAPNGSERNFHGWKPS